MKPKLIDRIKQAIYAFKHPREFYIGQAKYGVSVTECKDCEAKNTKVMYLCDCGACGGDCGRMCEHTTDIRHARNFVLIGDMYWEKRQDIVKGE